MNEGMNEIIQLHVRIYRDSKLALLMNYLDYLKNLETVIRILFK